jgi:hypothetical protein
VPVQIRLGPDLLINVINTHTDMRTNAKSAARSNGSTGHRRRKGGIWVTLEPVRYLFGDRWRRSERTGQMALSMLPIQQCRDVTD